VLSIRREREVATFGFRVEGRMWMLATAALVGLMVAGFATGAMRVEAIVPTVCAVIGVCTGTSGVLFSSRPMTWAGWMFVACACGTFFVPLVAQHLLFDLALALGYLLPGALLLRDERRGADG
jgi:hypothetical protein